MDRVSTEQRSKIMRSIRSKDTKPERALESVLPLGFDKHCRDVGNADFVYRDCGVAVFVDGDFWHGKDFESKKDSYSEHWREHIRGNMFRDERTTRRLREFGWLVLRFWESDVLGDGDGCARVVSEALRYRRSSRPEFVFQSSLGL